MTPISPLLPFNILPNPYIQEKKLDVENSDMEKEDLNHKVYLLDLLSIIYLQNSINTLNIICNRREFKVLVVPENNDSSFYFLYLLYSFKIYSKMLCFIYSF